MYELIHVKGNTYYINSPSKTGLVLNDDGAILIDSGNDKEAGKKMIKAAESLNVAIKTIINTHAHADHIGGNKVIIERTGAEAFSMNPESSVSAWPMWEPVWLYGGYPPKALRGKFLMTKPCESHDISELELPDGFEIKNLPGHAPGMIGIKTPDDVWFMGDCVFGENILDKYHVQYIFNVGEFLATLDEIEDMEAAKFIPAHAEPCDDLKELVRINREKSLDIIKTIKELCREEIGIEELITGIFDHYGLVMDFTQYVLVGSTTRSYCSYLSDLGELEAGFENNRLTWRVV